MFYGVPFMLYPSHDIMFHARFCFTISRRISRPCTSPVRMGWRKCARHASVSTGMVSLVARQAMIPVPFEVWLAASRTSHSPPILIRSVQGNRHERCVERGRASQSWPTLQLTWYFRTLGQHHPFHSLGKRDLKHRFYLGTERSPT